VIAKHEKVYIALTKCHSIKHPSTECLWVKCLLTKTSVGQMTLTESLAFVLSALISWSVGGRKEKFVWYHFDDFFLKRLIFLKGTEDSQITYYKNLSKVPYLRTDCHILGYLFGVKVHLFDVKITVRRFVKNRSNNFLLKIEAISKQSRFDDLDNVQALLALWRCVKECKNISFLPKKSDRWNVI